MRIACLAALLLFSPLALSAQSIYVKGNNTAAHIVREEIPKVTPYTVSASKKDAVYLLKVNLEESNLGEITSSSGHATICLLLEDKDKTQLWSKCQGLGIRYKTGIEKLLQDMKNSGKVK